MKKLLKWLLPQKHIWRETHRVNLGSYIDFGSCPQMKTTIYRIGVYETCLITGASRIREVNSLWKL
jgi:hypothetical protein